MAQMPIVKTISRSARQHRRSFWQAKKENHDTFLADITKEWENWATSRICGITDVRTTASIEGLFSRINEFNDHEFKTYSILANSIRLTGEITFRTRQNQNAGLKLPAGVRSVIDQRCVGQYALEMIWVSVLSKRDGHFQAAIPSPTHAAGFSNSNQCFLVRIASVSCVAGISNRF
jgi:hypothetical protein